MAITKQEQEALNQISHSDMKEGLELSKDFLKKAKELSTKSENKAKKKK